MSQASTLIDVLRARLEYELESPPFHSFLRPRSLGIDIENQAVSVLVPFRTDFKYRSQSPGIHGGVISAVIDLSAYAVGAVFSGCVCPTVSLNVGFLNAAPDADLISVARISKLGRQLCWAQIDVSSGDSNVATAKAILLIKKSIQ